jgi:mono/diheme cytochrome c family protein
MRIGLTVAAIWVVTLGTCLSAQIGGRAARPQVVPPQGAPRKVIFKSCTSCHGIDDYAYYALDRAGWDSLITTKHRDQKNVTLADADRAVLLDWLVEKFGPATKPFPRTYVAQEITTFFSDAEGEAMLKRACSGCHGVDKVNAARFTAERWRVVTVDMRERGAKVADDELERLVEWLGRTRGTNDNDRQ